MLFLIAIAINLAVDSQEEFSPVALGDDHITLLGHWGTWGTHVGHLGHSCGALGALMWGTWGTHVGHLGHSCGALGALMWCTWGTLDTPVGHLGHTCGAQSALIWGTNRPILALAAYFCNTWDSLEEHLRHIPGALGFLIAAKMTYKLDECPTFFRVPQISAEHEHKSGALLVS